MYGGVTMRDDYSEDFIESLKYKDLRRIRKIPKGDLHNHFVLGGNRSFIKERSGIDIRPFDGIINTMKEMDMWSDKYIGEKFNSSMGRKFLIEATFVQAKQDGVKVLEIGEDVWGLKEFFNNDVGELIYTFQDINHRIAPEIELRLQIGLSRHCPIDYLQSCLQSFWGHKEFYSIDLYGDESAQPIDNFIPIYDKAKVQGLRCKAHIGEWGSYQDVIHGIKCLNLDELQHGIAIADSDEAMDYVRQHNIRLNITPTSNLKLGRVENLDNHPIKKLYRSGIDVTINSDDILIFESDVSREYLRLYSKHCLTADELDVIRVNGLKKI